MFRTKEKSLSDVIFQVRFGNKSRVLRQFEKRIVAQLLVQWKLPDSLKACNMLLICCSHVSKLPWPDMNKGEESSSEKGGALEYCSWSYHLRSAHSSSQGKVIFYIDRPYLSVIFKGVVIS